MSFKRIGSADAQRSVGRRGGGRHGPYRAGTLGTGGAGRAGERDFIARLPRARDDLLATLCLATEAPIVLAPAMNRVMWANKARKPMWKP